MDLIVVHPSPSPSLEPLLRRRPFLLLPVMGKPLAAYHLDLASSLGARRVIFLAPDRPELLRQAVQTGRRWGLEAIVESVAPGLTHAEQLGRLSPPPGPACLLPAELMIPPVPADQKPELLAADWRDASDWGLLRADASLWRELPSLLARARTEARPLRSSSRITSARELHSLHLRLLEGSQGFVLPGFEVAPRIFVSRGCRFSLGAVVEPPVHVGEHARVSFQANLGPNVVVGPRCMIDDEATLRNSVVFPATYVGRLLEVENAILDGQLILKPEQDSVAAIGDDLLLANLESLTLAPNLRRKLERSLAVGLLILAFPLLLLAWLASARPRVLRREVYSGRLRLAVDGARQMQTLKLREFATDRLLLRRLGWLLDAAMGRIALFGNPPLAASEAEHLPPPMVERWLEAPVGAFGFAQLEELRAGRRMDLEELGAAAALYVASRGPLQDFRCLLSMLARVFLPRSWRLRDGGVRP